MRSSRLLETEDFLMRECLRCPNCATEYDVAAARFGARCALLPKDDPVPATPIYEPCERAILRDRRTLDDRCPLLLERSILVAGG